MRVSRKREVYCGGLRLGQQIAVKMENITTIEGCRRQWKRVLQTAAEAAQMSQMSLNAHYTEFVCVVDLSFFPP